MKRNIVEWTVLAVSCVAIVGLVGILIFEGLHERRPADPVIELRLDEARLGSTGWIVPADVANKGDEPTQGVVFEATATVEGEEESSEIEVDFLPAGTSVEIAFSFSAEPDGDVSVRLVGYRVP